MHAPGLLKHADRPSRHRPGWRAALMAAVAAAVLVATGSPALAAADVRATTVTITPGTIAYGGAPGEVKILLKNTGDQDALVNAEAFVPSSLTATGTTAWTNVLVTANGGTVELTFSITPAQNDSKRVTITVGIQSRNSTAPPDTRNQMFLRFASVRIAPVIPCCM